jgi:hypothetical protein
MRSGSTAATIGSAGLCAKAEDWPWSSARATAGLAPVPAFLDLSVLVLN